MRAIIIIAFLAFMTLGSCVPHDVAQQQLSTGGTHGSADQSAGGHA